MKTEIWLPIPGFEGRYSVSDRGEIMSMNYQRTNMLKIMQPTKDAYGYLSVGLSKNSIVYTRKVHVLVLLAFVGPRPIGLHINHKNGVKTDNRLENLEYCTPAENAQHAWDTGLQKSKPGIHSGKNNGRTKLTEAQVIEIKKKLAVNGKINKAAIAREYGVGETTIGRISSGDTWTHISGESLH